jgi:thymidylate synthase
MEFKPLYYADKVRIVNPAGDVGIVTLWSRPDNVCNVLAQRGVDLSSSSRIAVVANLFGNGLPHMLRNLLHNPQIRYIMVCGKNLSGSREHLANFFEGGLEETEFLGAKAHRIVGTQRIIDDGVRPEDFKSPPLVSLFGEEVSNDDTATSMKTHLLGLPSQRSCEEERIIPPPIPEPQVTRFPSNPAGHFIVRRTPMEAWQELVFRLYRFGHRNKVAKSGGEEERIELLNTHVVIEEPDEEDAEVLASFGFSLEKFRGYGARLLDPVLPSDLHYTYGHLLRTGLGKEPVDSLRIIGERLQAEPESRHGYTVLWRNDPHLVTAKHCPCLASIFFRKFEGKLTMTATFRAHNAMDGWPENLYGLMSIQRFVAGIAGQPPGSISMISQSISIDPNSLEKAKRIVEGKTTDQVLDLSTGKLGPRMDPHGEFTMTIDTEAEMIVVEHMFQGMKLAEYRGRTAVEIEQELARDDAVSVISHALYLGRELGRKEIELKAIRKKNAEKNAEKNEAE